MESKMRANPTEINFVTVGVPGQNRDQGDAGRDSLLEAVVAATSEIEKQLTNGSLPAGAALDMVAARAMTLTQASGVAIGLVEGSEVVCRASAGMAPDVGARIVIENGLSGECIRTGKIVRCDDTTQDDRVEQAAREALGLRSAVLVPIHSTGKIVGVLEAFSAESGAFDDWAVLAISQMARFIGGLPNATLQVESHLTTTNPLGPPFAAVPGVPANSETSEAKTRALGPASARRLRTVLLIASAVAVVFSAAHRVRDMIHSTPPAQPHAGINGPAMTPPKTIEPVAAAVPISSDEPKIAKEDGFPPETGTSKSLKPTAARHEGSVTHEATVAPIAASVSTPPAQILEPSGGVPRTLEVAPEPPGLALLRSATERDAVVAPLMKVAVADPTLAEAQAAPPARARRKPKFVSRVLGKPKKLIEKIPDKPNNRNSKGAPKTEPQSELEGPTPGTQSP
jgi:putative methionine-R-sulfoxide reductase with GAF domain